MLKLNMLACLIIMEGEEVYVSAYCVCDRACV